jgi:hypothetical protein
VGIPWVIAKMAMGRARFSCSVRRKVALPFVFDYNPYDGCPYKKSLLDDCSSSPPLFILERKKYY